MKTIHHMSRFAAGALVVGVATWQAWDARAQGDDDTYFLMKAKTYPTSLSVAGDWCTGDGLYCDAITSARDFANIHKMMYLRPPEDEGGWFEGKSMTLGWRNGNRGGAWLFLADNAFLGFSNDGLFLWDGMLAIGSTGGMHGTIKGDVTVLAPGSNPFLMKCGIANYELTFDGKMTSDVGTGLRLGANEEVKVGDTFWNDSAANISYVLAGDVADYLGVVEMTGGVAQVSFNSDGTLESCASRLVLGGEYRFGGKIVIGGESVLETRCSSGLQEVAELELRDGAVLVLPVSVSYSNGTGYPSSCSVSGYKVDALTALGSVRLSLPGLDPVPDGETNRFAMLTVPLGASINPETFSIAAGAPSYIPYRLVVEANDADQTKTLYLEVEPFAVLLSGDSSSASSSGNSSPSSLTNAANWSVSGSIRPDLNYLVRRNPLTYERTYVRSPGSGRKCTADFSFAGKRLILGEGGTFMSHTAVFRSTGEPIRFCGGSTLQFLNSQDTAFVGGVEILDGTTQISTFVGSVFDVDVLTGNGTIKTGTMNNESASGYHHFHNTSGFAGVIDLQQTKPANIDPYYERFQSLYIHGNALGARMDEFDFKALRVNNYSAIRLDSEEADQCLEDTVNRGIYIDGFGRFLMDRETDRLRVDWPITLNGTLFKEGPGTLVLGGRMMFGSAAAELPSDTADFYLAGGRTVIASPEAVNGARLIVSNGATLVVAYAPAAADMLRYGLCLDKSPEPFVLDEAIGGKLPIKIDLSAYSENLPRELDVGLLTVNDDSATLAAVRGMLQTKVRIVGVKGYGARMYEAAGEKPGTVTFRAEIGRRGLVISIR